MVELIKWWNNSNVRLILRYRTLKGRVVSSINLEAIKCCWTEGLKPRVNTDKLIRNGLRCLFGITLWKIKSALPPGTNQFSWHPNLFGLAIILYTEAYWVKRSFNPYYLRSLFGLGWTGRNRLHVLLSALASYSSYYGLYSIWVTKNINNKPHFTSWHGQVGLASMIGWSKRTVPGLRTIWFDQPSSRGQPNKSDRLHVFDWYC